MSSYIDLTHKVKLSSEADKSINNSAEENFLSAGFWCWIYQTVNKINAASSENNAVFICCWIHFFSKTLFPKKKQSEENHNCFKLCHFMVYFGQCFFFSFHSLKKKKKITTQYAARSNVPEWKYFAWNFASYSLCFLLRCFAALHPFLKQICIEPKEKLNRTSNRRQRIQIFFVLLVVMIKLMHSDQVWLFLLFTISSQLFSMINGYWWSLCSHNSFFSPSAAFYFNLKAKLKS